MASAYFVVSNALSTQISLDGGDFRQAIPASGTLNIYSNDLVGNKALCDQLSTLVTAGSISVTRSGTTITSDDLTSFGYGADMISSRMDADGNFIADSSETIEVVNTTSVVVGDSPMAVTSAMKTLLVDTSGGAIELDLPAVASSTGMSLLIKDVGGNAGTANITVDPNGAAETIDGSVSSVVLDSDYCSYEIFCDGSGWFSVVKDADMAKSVYDTTDSGVVDSSEAITDGVTTVSGANMIKAQQGYVGSITSITDADSPFSALVSHEVISCDSTAAPIAITMPDASAMANKTIVIKDSAGTADSNNITISQSGSGDVIDGAASLVLSQEYGSVKFLSNGVDWLSTEKTRSKVGAHSHTQAVAATATDFQFVCPGPGRIVYAAAFSGATADVAESMSCDVFITGVSCLTAAITLDAAATTTNVEGTIDAATNSFVKGSRIAFDRIYAPGGAPTPMVDTVISIVYELD